MAPMAAIVATQPSALLNSDSITPEYVFDIIRSINDPEHPQTLEQLRVVLLELIHVNGNSVNLTFTPTIPHCSMATLIGLCIRVKLQRNLPKHIKFDVSITPGTHAQDIQVSKQLRDKERVSAALENPNLLSIVENCIETSKIDTPAFNSNASCGNTGSTDDNTQKNDDDNNNNNTPDECCQGGNHHTQSPCCRDEQGSHDLITEPK